MQFSLRTVMLVFLLVVPVGWGIFQYVEYQSFWKEFAVSSRPRSFWKKQYLCRNFEFLDKIDDQYFDFRFVEDVPELDTRWTTWRTPFTPEAMEAHVQHFELKKSAMDERIENELTYFPNDWNLRADVLEVWERQGFVGAEISYFATFVLVDRRKGVIYFYDKDRDVPP